DDTGWARSAHWHRLVPAARLAHDLDAVGLRQDHAQAGTDERLVVGQHHPDAHQAGTSASGAGCNGSVAATRNPFGAAGPALSSPPSMATRARIPGRPWPPPWTGPFSPAAPTPSSVTSRAGSWSP